MNETLPVKSASEVRSPSVTLQERQQLKEDINRLTGEQLGRLVKLIYAQEPSLDSNLQNIEVDIEKVRPATLRAMQSFMSATLKKSNQNDSNSECGSGEHRLCISSVEGSRATSVLLKAFLFKMSSLMFCRKTGGEAL